MPEVKITFTGKQLSNLKKLLTEVKKSYEEKLNSSDKVDEALDCLLKMVGSTREEALKSNPEAQAAHAGTVKAIEGFRRELEEIKDLLTVVEIGMLTSDQVSK